MCADITAKGECRELSANLVEAAAFLEEELVRNPISVGRAVLWLASCASNCAACSSLLRQGTALVSLAQSLPRNGRVPSPALKTGHDGGVGVCEGEDVAAGGALSRRRWLPATVLALPRRSGAGTPAEELALDSNDRFSSSPDSTQLPSDAPASSDNDSKRASASDRQCPCSAVLSPCLEEALGLHPPTSVRTTTTTSNNTKRTGVGEGPPAVAPRQLSMRALPASAVGLASAVELSGPYPVSATTYRPDLSGGRSSGGQASQVGQPPARLTTAMASVLPSALDEEVLAKGSVCCVAGLFAMVVTKVLAEEGQREGNPVAQLPSDRSTETLVARVHGDTELRLLPPAQSALRGGRAEDPGGAAGAGVPDGRQPPSRDCEGNVAAVASAPAAASAETQTQAPPGRYPAGPSAAPPRPPHCFPESREWIRLVGQDFGGLGDQVASAVASAGTALRGGGSRGGGFLTTPASGLLLHGPTGAGKTLLARSIAEHSGAPWFFLDCASVFRRDRGDAEQHAQDFLAKAGACWPSVVILDQVESVCRRRPEAAGIAELQVLSVLLEMMDRFRHPPFAGRVFFLATCPDAAVLDPSLLQRGRLETVLQLGALDIDARAAILGIHARGMPLELLPPLPPPPLAAAAAAPAAISDLSPPKARVVDKAADVPARKEETTVQLTKPNPSIMRMKAAAARAMAATTTLPRTREEFLGLVAARCHGYLGSDLERLCREAAMNHMSAMVEASTVNVPRTATTTAATAKPWTGLGNKARASGQAGRRERGSAFVEGDGCEGYAEDDDGSRGESGVRLCDFWAALDVVRPASLVGHSVGMRGGDMGRERGEASAPPTPLVGCDAAMAELRAFIVTPLANPSLLRNLGLRGATGALLHGPPGCGKTSVARAVAAEVKGLANFLEVRCSDLVDKVVGRSERNVSDLFAAARAAAPCILFLDQVEGVAARRGYHSSTEQTFDRILSTLLIEMDGVMSEAGGHVVVLAATNDIKRLDPALLRPGRLDRRVRLGIPDTAARTAIFLQRLLNMPLEMEDEGAPEEGGVEGDGTSRGISHGAGIALHREGIALGTERQDSGVGVKGARGGDGAAAAGAADVVATARANGEESGRDAPGSADSSGSVPGGGQPRPQLEHERLPLSSLQSHQRRGWQQRWGLLDSSEAYAKWLAGQTEGSSAAHVAGVCREAVLAALREGMGAKAVAPRHFEMALGGR